MKQFLTIEFDSEDDFVHVHAVTQDFSKTVDYHRSPTGPSLIISTVGADPAFYGKLDTLIVTKSKIDSAQALTPGTAVPTENSRIVELTRIVELLSEYLAESHEEDLGSDHGGDGPEGCSYCETIAIAKRWTEGEPWTPETARQQKGGTFGT